MITPESSTDHIYISVQLMEESDGKKRIKLGQNGNLTYFLDAGDVPAMFGSSAEYGFHIVS
jgi:hypothetical protein